MAHLAVFCGYMPVVLPRMVGMTVIMMMMLIMMDAHWGLGFRAMLRIYWGNIRVMLCQPFHACAFAPAAALDNGGKPDLYFQAARQLPLLQQNLIVLTSEVLRQAWNP